jgi:hypothetical protein
MWAPPVVMGAVSGEDGPQVPLTEDQHAVGELGLDGQHEPFSEAVRPRTPRRIHQQIPGLLGGPRSGRMAGRSQGVHVAAVDFQGEEQ